MRFRIVESKQNVHLKDLRRALAHPGQDRHSLAGGSSPTLAGIEGPNLLEEALRAGLRIPWVFVAQGAEHLLDDLDLPAETEVLQVPKEVLDSALSTETPQPVAALIEPPSWSWADAVVSRTKATPLIVVLAGLQDPGNLGTILRSAEAFGATATLSLPGTVSAWNPKAVRASAGSVFRLPLLETNVEECFSRLREASVRIWTTAVPTVANCAEPADRIDLASPVALLIGNEGNGVPQALAELADGAVTIPCPGPVESLNAAAAVSVLLYEASRQRRGAQ
ncbi:MAG: RNA methyltransferase [Terracidiphilus sp.]|jgi:TrmH family RNA methyltransferase